MAQVVLNRVRSGIYPATVCGVVYQDRNRPFEPPATRPAAGQVGGFGLFIISDLARWVRVDRSEHGNVLSFAV